MPFGYCDPQLRRGAARDYSSENLSVAATQPDRSISRSSSGTNDHPGLVALVVIPGLASPTPPQTTRRSRACRARTCGGDARSGGDGSARDVNGGESREVTWSTPSSLRIYGRRLLPQGTRQRLIRAPWNGSRTFFGLLVSIGTAFIAKGNSKNELRPAAVLGVQDAVVRPVIIAMY